MRSKFTITIAIPTYNRASTLRATLESVAALDLGGEIDAECLVVDNNSSDDTPEVIERVAAGAPVPIRRVPEARQGSSFARNRAIDEARGDFLFFLDDDVVVERAWARELLAEIQRRKLDVACGAVLPRWSTPPPPWLGPRLYAKLAIHHERLFDQRVPGERAINGEPGRVDSSGDRAEALEYYFSANVGFRRDAFERFGRFREDLGVVAGNPVSGEDTELFARIIARGGAVGFAPRARVYHLIGAERMNPAYLRRKSFAYGVGSAYAGGRTHNHLDKLIRNAWRMALAAARGDREGVIYHQMECMNFLGYWRARLARR